MSARLWSLGVLLVAVGVAAHVVGWDRLLWVPRVVIDSFVWVPAAIIDAIRSSPATSGIIALGILLMVVSRLVGRRKGQGGG